MLVWSTHQPDTTGFKENFLQEGIPDSSIDYFKKYISDSLFEEFAEKTNIYALQSGKTRLSIQIVHTIDQY